MIKKRERESRIRFQCLVEIETLQQSNQRG
jgi:hypothetical protein